MKSLKLKSKIPPTETCNGRNRAKTKYCKRKAGHGTDHLGEGRCDLHGGLSPIRHGRWSSLKNRRLGEIFDQIKKEGGDPLDLVEDLTMVRAVAIDFMNRSEQLQEALLVWHNSFVEILSKLDKDAQIQIKEWLNNRPRKVLDLSRATELIKSATSIVETIERIRNEGSISMENHVRVVQQMAMAVTQEFSDPKYIPSLRRIEKSWRKIVVDSKVKPRPDQLSEGPVQEDEKIN